jgi:hypothetical protein
MKLRYFLFAALVIVSPYAVDVARACQCLQRQPPCADYWQADAVFVGTVTDISPAFGDYESYGSDRTVRFSLEQAYRGVEGQEVELVNWINSCEYQFEKGKKYFVYAYRNSRSNTLGTHGCSRTTEVSHATEDIAYVRGVSSKHAEQSISGVVLENRYTPVTGVKINIRGEGRHYNASTDGEGRFKVLIIQPGKYSVRFILPRNSGVIGVEEQLNQFTTYKPTDKNTILGAEVDIQVGRCAFFDVPLVIDRESP